MNERTIFLEALDQPTPEQRDAFLQRACGPNAELRQKIDQLIAAHTDAGSFIEHSPAGAQTKPLDDPSATTDRTYAGQQKNPSAAAEIDLSFLRPCDVPNRLGRLGHYEVIEVLGRGAFGIVLRALDPKLNRIVAIKVLSPGLATSPMSVRRFLREAQAAAAVSHDHIVTIFAVDDSTSLPYLVMECVIGQSLHQKIHKEGALPVAEILRIGMQIAWGLAAAHQQGLVHRDIKPANILLENGVQRVKITDFGLATVINDLDATQSYQVAGTPQYMSPEQAHGETVDQRSDLFSLGSVLYMMCTGRPAFRADTLMAVLKRVCEDTPRPIREVNPDIPDWLSEIVSKLLQKSPQDRYQTAAEVARVLESHLAELQHKSLQRPSQAAIPIAQSPADRRIQLVRWTLAILACIGVAIPFIQHYIASTVKIDPKGSAEQIVEPKSDNSIQSNSNLAGDRSPESHESKPFDGRFDFTAEREAAKWVLSQNGAVKLIRPNGTPLSIVDRKLPDEQFAVQEVTFQQTQSITDDDLASLSRCRGLTNLFLRHVSITGIGLKHLEAVSSLQVLDFSSSIDSGQSPIADPLASISKLSHLRTLNLSTDQASDATLQHVGALIELEAFSIRSRNVTDAGVKHLHRLRNLTFLGLNAPSEITDEGVRMLVEQHPGLKTIMIPNDQATARNRRTMAPLATAQEMIHVGLSGDQLTDDSLAVLQRLPRLESISVFQPSDSSIALIGKVQQIKSVHLQCRGDDSYSQSAYCELEQLRGLERLSLAGGTTLPTDNSLIEIARFPKLQSLTITRIDRNTPQQQTSAGVKAFCEARPAVVFYIDGVRQPAGVAPVEPTQSRFDFVAERSAAEWVLAQSGTMNLVRPNGTPLPLVNGKLPDEPLVIQDITFTQTKTIQDDDLKRLNRCRGLAGLFLRYTPVTGSGFRYLKSVSSLKTLDFVSEQAEPQSANDDPLATISDLKSLRTLNLSIPDVSDATLAHVAALTELESLGLGGTNVTDAGLRHLDSLRNLNAFTLGAFVPITDEGIRYMIAKHPGLKWISIANPTGFHLSVVVHRTVAPLVDAKELTYAGLSTDQLTASSVPILKQLQKLDTIYALQLKNTAFTTLGQLSQVKILNLQWNAPENAFTQDSYRELSRLPNLERLLLLGASSLPTDESLLEIAKIPRLKWLMINRIDPTYSYQHTAAGSKAFRDARPDVKLIIVGEVPPDNTTTQ